MPYQVHIDAPLADVPADVEAALYERLREIAASLDSVPRESVALWNSLAVSGLVLDVRDWRFLYRIDRRTLTLIVDQVLFQGDGPH